ncbi:MAG TPA: alanine--glyoxylate aminotransferase family protein [Chloroflexota bacterium]|nr:alanine--glyoxylate aminotransferase family protein [Chloroflexota bacterium]
MPSNLRVPGPTPVPPDVAQAGARPMVNHRGPEFAAVMRDIITGLKPFFGCAGDPLLLTGSGTGAQEAAIVNMLSPGDDVVAVVGGVFGARFADIAAAFGASVRRVDIAWGQAARPEVVAAALQPLPRAVILTHNETSTGVTNDIAALAAAIRAVSSETLIIVDGVSSIGALPFELDHWDVDVVITGSQKAWMSPPGLAMVAVSERGWEAFRQATMPRYYWDFGKARKNGANGTTPFTPAVGVAFALQEALRQMLAEGPENVFARHRTIGSLLREGVQDLGLELFAEPAAASNTVTAVQVLDDVDAGALLRGLRERHGVVVGSGQDWLKGRIFRVGHMGFVREEDVEAVLRALRTELATAAA